jgi:hypothetical protein
LRLAVKPRSYNANDGALFLTQISSDQWIAIAAIAQVLAALATLAAVFFAIYQWNHQWRPKLKVSLDSMLTATPSGVANQWIVITVTNIGICAVKVTGIQYRPHRFAKMRWFHPPDFANPHCTRLPVKLEQTDTANLIWTPQDWETAISGALNRVARRFEGLSAILAPNDNC